MNHIIPSRYSSTRSNRRAANNSLDTAEHSEFENPTLPQLKQTLAEVVGLNQALAKSQVHANVGLEQLKVLVERNLQLTQDLMVLMQKDSKERYFAYHDELTLLPNRRLLHDRFRQTLAQAQRQHKQVVVLLLDLDGFKGVNDRLGHAAGDQLLQQVAKRLNDCVRVADTVCRYGGDEFVLVLPEIEHDNTAGVVADKIRTHLDAPYLVDGNVIDIKASIGIAVYPNDGEDYRGLIEHADLAMYRAKAANSPTSRVV